MSTRDVRELESGRVRTGILSGSNRVSEVFGIPTESLTESGFPKMFGILERVGNLERIEIPHGFNILESVA